MSEQTYAKLIQLLDERGARYRLIDHPPEGRTEIVSALRGHHPRLAAKCMILIVKLGKKTTRYVLAVVPGHQRVDLAAVKDLLGATYVSFASPAIAEGLAGSAAGTVLPFALKGELELIVDPALCETEELYFNAALLDRSVALKTSDYLAIARPRKARIAGEGAEAPVPARASVAKASGASGDAPTAPAPAPDTSSPLLAQAAFHAARYLGAVRERHVGAQASGEELRKRLRRPLPEDGEDSRVVIDDLAEAGRDGTIASQGPRYFGFVTGGSLPVATAADWLVSAWDQNAQLHVMSPLASVVEDIAAEWLKDVLGLPVAWSVGFVTGAQMASFTALLAARHHLLSGVGWDVERDGLFGAPPIQVFVSEESHRTIFTALRMSGLGAERVRRVDTDAEGRMRPDRLEEALRSVSGPFVVCVQAGNVNTGAFDPLGTIAPLVRERGGWLHVDAAFGLWAAASMSLRPLVAGIEQADSVASDAHKWLNVPYDSGLVFTAHPESHQRALMVPAPYLPTTPGERDPRRFTPDESRRARGVTVYAALRALGRSGVRDLVERCCACARRMAEALGQHAQVRILNEVVLNQVLVRFSPLGGDPGDADAFTDRVVAAVQGEGTCWMGATQWHGQRAARISICNWSTREGDIDRSAAAILGVVDKLSLAA